MHTHQPPRLRDRLTHFLPFHGYGGFSPDAEHVHATLTQMDTHLTRSLAIMCTPQHETKAWAGLLVENSTAMQNVLGTKAVAVESGGSARSGSCAGAAARGLQWCAQGREERTCPSKVPTKYSTSQASRGSADPLEPV